MMKFLMNAGMKDDYRNSHDQPVSEVWSQIGQWGILIPMGKGLIDKKKGQICWGYEIYILK